MGLNGFIFKNENYDIKEKKNPGSRLGFLFLFNMTFYIYFSKYETISLRPMPAHFWNLSFQL